MQKDYLEVEAIIEERIAKESEEWDLDRHDIDQIRLEAYKENGWTYDPKPYDDEDEEEEEEYRYEKRDFYFENGINYRNFF